MTAAQTVLLEDVRALYAGHHGWLYAWLCRKLSCSHRAADLAQDTFVRLLARDEPLAALREPRAFLTTVAQRVLANHWRREQIERAYLDALAQAPQALVPSPEERAILLETLVEIDRRLDGLPTLAKRAFLHSQLDGMAHAEIAAELGISVTTVKRHLVRAATQCYFALGTD
ncbi:MULTISPECIES: sigma-70 family RNA polymerase sigma factor [unclassified Acidovorax]|uniref:sigma-70 family RNA polymerase sigma factor n=1 Tax=unclassified Acidovorax TaxID=2684926 RepID=UPI0023498057|nr:MULTISPECIES: sigma-70 family RNA polymerase sigma factor [unclassified Acidovorax]WCM96642.1 sigma-70 family RNA polymerase sigma factor [Acidovorax sp. GBBC 1281]GKS92847.1 sigma-70 family RNA polymerase sigma factor [Acidovorax sp. SUPP2539]GKS97549.1 sigma-70 family RNA polymerase sigma factor [Acidovorax sp. SUPP2825]GKT19255.1 sigma-70 family RNA polymerase sigma factor [Acidovorax sp. SUPP2522]